MDGRIPQIDRRDFLKGLAVAGATDGAHRGAAGDPAARPADTPAPPAAGMLAARMAASGRRLTAGVTPAFTPEFVVADVALSPPRRFNEFSGDLSGRYIGALAGAPAGSGDRLAPIVRAVISHQRRDGRFGDEALAFTASAIGPPHMALLWGNGRLLVGLLEYWQRHPDPAVLASATRLGDFLVAVRQQCADPAVARRVEGQGAFGFICFTQLIEGLVLAARATGDTRYLDTAEEIAPLLPPRGIQHSHGYLTTLRGVMLLHDARKDRRWLEFVKERYDDLTRSPDYTIYRSVLEYFGWDTPGVPAEERQHLLEASGQHPRDEGCSSADFVRLSLQLWRATRNDTYFDRAELALENALYPNQWETGDFGSRVTFDRGLMPTANAARCWWCCTMHGHRALADVREAGLVADSRGVTLTLLCDVDWQDGARSLTAARTFEPDGTMTWRVKARGLGRGEALFVRHPSWGTVDSGRPVAGLVPEAGGEMITAGDDGGIDATLRVTPRLRLVQRDGTNVDLASTSHDARFDAALFCGPWLMAADEAREPLFFGEPWQDNVVSLVSPSGIDVGNDLVPRVAVKATYEHGGFAGRQPVTLTPLATQSVGPQRTLAVWLKYRIDERSA